MSRIICSVFLFSTFLVLTTACFKKADRKETIEVVSDTIKKSIPKEEHAIIGDAHITVKYHSPGVKGRVIWGGLVPLDQVWVTGAHMATSFEINKDFEVNGTTIPAGKYALFTIPGKEEWTFIINKNWEQHLADEYSAKDNIVRVNIEPETDQPHQERLSYTITASNDREATLVIAWEKIKISIPLKIKSA